MAPPLTVFVLFLFKFKNTEKLRAFFIVGRRQDGVGAAPKFKPVAA
jgi:hypothetical protein